MSKEMSKEQSEYEIRVAVHSFVNFQITKDKGLSKEEVIKSIGMEDMPDRYYTCEALDVRELHEFMYETPGDIQVSFLDRKYGEWVDVD
jgi:hypothetical protein